MKTVYDISKTKIGSHLIASKGYEKINYNAYGISRHVGVSLRRPFTDFTGIKDIFKIDKDVNDQIKNWLAWFGFEEMANKYYSEKYDN